MDSNIKQGLSHQSNKALLDSPRVADFSDVSNSLFNKIENADITHNTSAAEVSEKEITEVSVDRKFSGASSGYGTDSSDADSTESLDDEVFTSNPKNTRQNSNISSSESVSGTATALEILAKMNRMNANNNLINFNAAMKRMSKENKTPVVKTGPYVVSAILTEKYNISLKLNANSYSISFMNNDNEEQTVSLGKLGFNNKEDNKIKNTDKKKSAFYTEVANYLNKKLPQGELYKYNSTSTIELPSRFNPFGKIEIVT
jgi:hypothetical protein